MRVFCLMAALLVCLSSEETPTRGFVLKRQQDKSCLALVVGNAAYPDQPLANPANDATDVATALEGVGFTVMRLINADRATFQKAVDSFGAQIKGKQASAFYYAGHGMQVNGENYLIPVGEQIDGETDVPFKAVNAGLILAKMEAAQCPLNIIILDACRNNPLARSSRGVAKGLTELRGPAGSLIVYSTAPGQVAGDGVGRNGVFTTALLRHISTPGQNIDMCLRVVSSDVQKTTGGSQIPWRSSSLTQDFCFVPQLSPEDLSEERKRRGSVLTELEKQQDIIDEQRKQSEDLIRRKQAEIAELDKRIIDAKKKLDGEKKRSGAFEELLSMIEKQNKESQELERMSQQAAELMLKYKRDQELIVQQGTTRRSMELEADLVKYRRIKASPSGQEAAPHAWKLILKKWQSADVSMGDEAALRKALALDFPIDAKVPWATSCGVDSYGTWATLKIGGVLQRMRYIPQGRYRMGAEIPMRVKGGNELKEAPASDVEVKNSFWIADSETTQELWAKVMGYNPSYFIGDAQRPVDQVSRNDIREFIKAVKTLHPTIILKLPTSMQWEYACRAGDIKDEMTDLDASAWWEKIAKHTTHPVMSKMPNSWGIFDSLGNVSELCEGGACRGSNWRYGSSGGAMIAGRYAYISTIKLSNDFRSNENGFRFIIESSP